MQDAFAPLTDGATVYIQGGAATPTALIQGLVERAAHLSNVTTVSLHLEGPAPHVAPEMAGHIRHNALFIGANVRDAVQSGRADFTPAFLSDIPRMFQDGTLPLDVALVQVSPPDAQGYCSLGVSVDVARPAAQVAHHVIASVNPQMPRTLGDTLLHLSRFDAVVDIDSPIHEVPPPALTEAARQVARHVATLVEDGATLQLGIGAIPEAVLQALGDHRELGIHTEMFSDGVVDLVERGVVTGSRKRVHPGRVISSFVMGTRRLYDFVDRNPLVEMYPSHYTNDPGVIAQHQEMVAINSAIEVDLTGQVCADSIGPRFYSGIGGQLDFIRGAARAPRGRPIIAMTATALGGRATRIVSQLARGAGVVTTRGDVHFVVTEHGIAELHGKSVRVRAQNLVRVAAPEFREQLSREAFEVYGLRLQV